ncbi:DUF5819 family protein [Streptomyces sp. NPDC058255]|uniref:DUF5819 family protein n=1 Tax=Streptomyces sp. NPDC058255 TaxID=3346407 RepID=UPI0036E1134B
MDAHDEGSTTGPGPDGSEPRGSHAPDGSAPRGSDGGSDGFGPHGSDTSAPRRLDGSESRGADRSTPHGPGESETDGPETGGSETDGPETDGPETDGPETGGSETDGPETGGSETDGSAAPEDPTHEKRTHEKRAPETLTPETLTPAPTGIAALSIRYQVAAALALAVVAVAACVHLGMVFLHVAPSNTVTKQHGRAIDEWIYPEFEQNWKLFAPNPLQQNISVQVRALVRGADGTSRETGWFDLSALDGREIDGNLLPSHTQQNELRRAWDFYASTHDAQDRPAGLRGDLSERYLRRVAVLRLDREHAGGEGAVLERVQVRSRTTNVPPPKWSEEQVSDKPLVRELPWWSVPEDDRTDGLTEASAR